MLITKDQLICTETFLVSGWQTPVSKILPTFLDLASVPLPSQKQQPSLILLKSPLSSVPALVAPNAKWSLT